MTATYLSDRALIRLTAQGEDDNVVDFLQGLVTQDVSKLGPDNPLWSGLLTAQGKALFDFILWADGDDVLIDCEVEARDDLIRRLTIYRLRRDITIEPDDDRNVHWSLEPRDGAVADPRMAELGWRWLAPAGENVDQTADAAWHAHRLSLGVTEGRTELGDDKTLWLECNAEELNGVAYDKGCFIGQENTARMHYRSRINRRLAIVPVDTADEKRLRHTHEDHGLAVVHIRVEGSEDLPLPEWQKEAIIAHEQKPETGKTSA
ncbi:YgfZ/GcvT domain-containing protein [Alterisphingorhabdus coralli]|uniref:Folate-binding protein n=1 Tax=Alterisphingorhabdus coralli TaxID=3071408 RepID=A0AA97F961_9SPHN|nr:folate-binding protein [Parasphingorhabdus sp. SCSIO 66989]WOE76201.1 folate-binding protein [Parasphingorhabdus sp. SCSIO 66989]